MFRFIYVFQLLLLLWLSGCASIQPPAVTGQDVNSKAVNGKVGFDGTFGRYEESLEAELILITVTPERHLQLTEIADTQSAKELPRKYAAFLNRMHTSYGLTRVADWPLPAIDVHCIIFETKDTRSRDAIVRELGLEPDIETAQIVQTFDVLSGEYNDPYLALQHGLHSLQAIFSHRWSRGKGVRIAVVDTGTDTNHPDLESSTELTRNFVDKDEQRFHNDVHGTAVSGIIAATADNRTGMVGVAPDANLLALKACWQMQPTANGARCNSLTLAKALNFSIKQNVDIINLSLTGPPDPLLERLVEAAIARNIIVVGAQPSHDKPAFPTSVAGTIAVAMPDTASSSLSAPGRRVLSTLPNQQYDFFDGSSFSTAHISGLAAVIRSLSPALTPDELRSLLELTADARTGAVNACRAVEAVRAPIGVPAAYKLCL